MSPAALIFLFLALSSNSFKASAVPEPSGASSLSDSDPVHDRLPMYGLPKGLVPNYVKSQTFSAETGEFEVELQDSPCYAQQAYLVYYDTKIRGRLSYGRITGLTGVRAQKLFLWVPITGMVAHPEHGEIEFQSGFFSERLPIKQFEEIATCRKNGFGTSMVGFWRGIGSM